MARTSSVEDRPTALRRELPVGIGFIGAGMVSELHAAAIARSAAARLVGIHDIDLELAQRRAEDWTCRAHPTLEAMLAEPDIEAVFVLAPTRLHIELARRVLRAGKHVLVEKPVSRSPADIRRLMALADRRGLVCVPGHNYAYIPEYRRVKRLVREGSLGLLRLGAVMFAIAHSEEVAAHYDGVTWLVMPHLAYLMHGLFGLPARVTSGTTQPGWASLERDDQSWIVLDYPPHTTALLFTTLGADDDSADPWTFVLKVLGTRGSASTSWRSAVIRRATGSMSLGWVPYEEAYEHQLAAFVAAVRGDRSLLASTMDEAIAVARIVTAAESSIRLGRTVSLRGSKTEDRS
jgi:predicted dehydrogenase